MKTERTGRNETSLASQSTRIAAYSIAAGAAASALSTDAEAQVVYSGLQELSVNQGFAQEIDLDGDINTDITLKNYVFVGGNYQGASVNFAPGKLVGFSVGSLSYATALTAGDPIDSTTIGSGFTGSLAYGANNLNAQFNNVTDAYIGFSFVSGVSLHYAWLRVDIDNTAGTFLIHDWAYELTPEVGISAGDMVGAAVPEPATAGLLAALTVGGVAAFRRRRKVQA